MLDYELMRHRADGLCGLLPHRLGLCALRQEKRHPGRPRTRQRRRLHRGLLRLDITAIDPLKYDLLFERFLNPERVSMPDLDIDF